MAMDLMCGQYGSAYCTPQRWFDFMGDDEVPFVPFRIKYISGDAQTQNFTPYNPVTHPCNVGMNVSSLQNDCVTVTTMGSLFKGQKVL
jgi:hypothetical protein